MMVAPSRSRKPSALMSAGLTAANEQLGGTKGVLETTFAALGKVSESMVKVRETLTRLADGTINDSQRAQYEAQYTALRTQIGELRFGRNLQWTHPA
jgi:flagellin-like hook-associated protein FlgL